MLTLIMPNNALTISIITTVLYAPHGQNGMAGRTVKTNQSAQALRDSTDDSRQQSMSERWRAAGATGFSMAT
jgi:hypothetical protein